MEAPTSTARRILVLTQNPENVRIIQEATLSWMFEIVVCATAAESRELLSKQEFALAFCEHRFEGNSYAELVSILPPLRRMPVFVMISEANRDRISSDAMTAGAIGVLAVPFSKQDAQWAIIQGVQSTSSRRRVRGDA
jgi:CheY-like chemotaxis protein